MNITGLITEYNPFHNGHKLHLEKAKEITKSDATLAIMSGNFMQRGIPSIIDKWTRAEMALLNGVDLVIELPLIFSLSSAEDFSFGAINILNSTNIVNNIFFGSECGNITSLKSISTILYNENDNFKKILKNNLDLGLPFHKARSNALSAISIDTDINTIISNSNNILGIEYIKALLKLNSSITPYTFKREESKYNDENLGEKFSSATSIRNVLRESENLSSISSSVPKESLDILNKLLSTDYKFTFAEDMFSLIKYRLLINSVNFNNLSLSKEGLDNKILSEILNSQTLDEFILKVKSKRYTYTRISRLLCSIYIGLDFYNIDSIKENFTPYIRPLAFNKKGAKILKEIKENSDIEIYTKLPKKISNPSLSLDILGTKAYSILNSSINPMSDYKKSPIIIM